MSATTAERVGSDRERRTTAIGLIAVLIAFIGLVAVQATSASSARILERTGGASLIGSMDPKEYAALRAIDYASAPSILVVVASVLLWALFAVVVWFGATRLGSAPLARVSVVAAWSTLGAWILTLVLELLLVLQGGEGFSAGFWTWWFWGQALVSVSAATAIGFLALSVRALPAGWRITIAAFAALLAVGALTVEVPPASAVALGAVLGMGLLFTRRGARRVSATGT